jgi:hypothetical protein
MWRKMLSCASAQPRWMRKMASCATFMMPGGPQGRVDSSENGFRFQVSGCSSAAMENLKLET